MPDRVYSPPKRIVITKVVRTFSGAKSSSIIFCAILFLTLKISVADDKKLSKVFSTGLEIRMIYETGLNCVSRVLLCLLFIY